jgi:hypothetical protein
MKRSLNILAALLITFSANAQHKIKMPTKYDIVVAFGSMCCGTAADNFLSAYVKGFNKKYKVTVPAYKASGCGREGEYNVLFSLAKLKTGTKRKFLGDLKALIPQQEQKNKTKDANSGSISLEYNKEASDYNFCRDGISRWK